MQCHCVGIRYLVSYCTACVPICELQCANGEGVGLDQSREASWKRLNPSTFLYLRSNIPSQENSRAKCWGRGRPGWVDHLSTACVPGTSWPMPCTCQVGALCTCEECQEPWEGGLRPFPPILQGVPAKSTAQQNDPGHIPH